MSESQVTLFELYWHDGCLFTFIVEPNRDLRVEKLPLSRARLMEYVRSFRSAFHEADLQQQQSGAWNELSHSWLEGQLDPFIESSDRIVFVPHSVFHHLPLHLLSYRGRPLAIQRAVSYSPSATLLLACRDRNRRGFVRQNESHALSIGVDFEEEATVVSKLTGGELWLESRGEVSKAKILAAMAGSRIVHFSCHGVFDLYEPMSSGLFLDPLGDKAGDIIDLRNGPNFLSAKEIAQSRINAALVTLSACETAQTENLPGDEILGLTRSLFLAGAPSVVVSFWRVPAEPTMYFMSVFYRALLAGNISVGEAMKVGYEHTEIAYDSPAMWGGFAVLGDGVTPWTSH
jgi:CHAT domain-containing protein